MKVVYIYSAGEIASGVAIYLFNAGFNVVMGDRDNPSTVRRFVSFSSAIPLRGEFTVEGVTGRFVDSVDQMRECFTQRKIALTINPSLIQELKPDIIVDATISKCNALHLSTTAAPLVIGLGPELSAGTDCHITVETNRGHDLGRLIFKGKAEPNTHEPGNIGGFSTERVIRSFTRGVFMSEKHLGEFVKKGDVIGTVSGAEGVEVINAEIDGLIRGLLIDGFEISKQKFKIGDIDPRGDDKYLFTVTDKSRCIAGAVLNAVMQWVFQNK
ncbi:Selenium-dependent_molybdenum hydroxylase system protein [Hexamita inflata]|uniref:YqeB family n=1 Tax=Hexamita inflata TaxID=28002 RepID=A0AA86Q064_9EUKA|nr:Selenium-dependent molybdenum hydroxylase system protein [Hexamita inflata]